MINYYHHPTSTDGRHQRRRERTSERVKGEEDKKQLKSIIHVIQDYPHSPVPDDQILFPYNHEMVQITALRIGGVCNINISPIALSHAY